MLENSDLKSVILPDFDAADLGIPFKVTLVESVKQIVNPKTGKIEKTIIPNVPGLIKCVALSRILVPRKLSGAELKFVRKSFRTPAKKLAETIGVSPEHLSRCEAGERVLSAGAEKCLRISLFIDNNKLPEEIDKGEIQNEEVLKFVQIYRKALSKIENILDDMRINSAHDAEDELRMEFSASLSSDRDLFEDDPNADWLANENGHQIAA